MNFKNILDAPEEERLDERPGPFSILIVLPVCSMLFALCVVGMTRYIEAERVWLRNKELLLLSRIIMLFFSTFSSVFLFLRFSFYKEISTRKVNFNTWLMLMLGYFLVIVIQNILTQNTNNFSPIFLFISMVMALMATPLNMGIYAYFRFDSIKLLVVLTVLYLIILYSIFHFFST